MTIDNETYFALVEEQLSASGQVKIPLVGTSMQPTLCPGDLLTLAPIVSTPQVGNIVLFRYQGQHLLHRIVAVDGDHYTMRGDNCVSCEDAGRSDIIAKLVSVEKKNKLKHLAVRWLGPKGRKQLRPWYFVALGILMWAPLGGVPLDNYMLGLRLDHLLHASVFIPCSLFIYNPSLKKWVVWLTSVGVGVLTESIQALLPYRGFDINDMIANFLGVTLGFAMIILFQRGVRKQHQYPARAKRGGCK
jgi:signal peptidase I